MLIPIIISIQHSTWGLSQWHKARERGIKIIKEGIKLPLVTDNIIMYVENPRSYTDKLLESIRILSNIAEYKVNFLSDANKKELENESLNKYHLQSRNIMYLGINLIKHVQDLTEKNAT